MTGLAKSPSGVERDPEFDDHFDENERFSFVKSKFEGLRVLAFVCNTPVCKNALQLAKAMLAGRCTELLLVYVATSPYAFEGMNGVLDTLAEGFTGYPIRTEIFSKRDDQTLCEAMAEYVEGEGPDLVILGSTNLCNDARAEEAHSNKSRSSYTGMPQHLLRSASKPSRQSFAVKVCQALRSVAVLVVKANSKGGHFQYQATSAPPIKYMVDLQPTSRHMLAWLMGIMEAGKDALYLVVSKAYDAAGVTKQTAVRMITAFSVQASVNSFKPVRRMYKDPAEKCLPGAVSEDEIDVLMIQAPRSKDLSPYVINLLCSAATSILIFPPDSESTALGQRPAPSDDGASSASAIRSSYSGYGTPRPASRSTSISHDGSSSDRYKHQRPSTAQGYSYHGSQDQMDSVAQAAMDAMQQRMARRKQAEDKVMSNAINQQRGRIGSLGF